MRPAHWSLLLLMVAACGAGTVDGLPLVEMAPPRLGEPLAPRFFARARTPEESAQWRSRIAAVALIGLQPTIDFRLLPTQPEIPVRGEVEQLRGKRILCFYSVNERDSLCRARAIWRFSRS